MRTTELLKHTRRERGAALMVVLVMLVLCIGLASSLLMSTKSSSDEAEVFLNRERAYLMAESGLDQALARLRQHNGTIFDDADNEVTAHSLNEDIWGGGSYVVTLTRGDADPRDLDGDGLLGTSGETDYTVLQSTGSAGGVERRLEMIVHKTTADVDVQSALGLNVPVPVLDLHGQSFMIDGRDHNIDGTLNTLGTSLPGLTSTGVTTVLTSQIAHNETDQVIGTGSEPSVAQVAPIDIDSIIDQAEVAATIALGTGTYSDNASYGTIAAPQVVRCVGDVHFSGQLRGVGVLVVDGDVDFTGQVEWIGPIIVRGEVRFSGGGNTKFIRGAVIAGEGIAGSGTTNATVSGQADILYSSEGIRIAVAALNVVEVVTSREVGLQ